VNCQGLLHIYAGFFCFFLKNIHFYVYMLYFMHILYTPPFCISRLTAQDACAMQQPSYFDRIRHISANPSKLQ